MAFTIREMTNGHGTYIIRARRVPRQFRLARSPQTERTVQRMSVRVVRLGSPRVRDEGVRIGTVRRPPRGVPKNQFARQNWYDVWFPNLAPSVQTMKLGLRADTSAQWSAFVRKYKAEMKRPDAKHDLQLLAALSHKTNFSVGCYCEDEEHCHRSILKQLLIDNGAAVE